MSPPTSSCGGNLPRQAPGVSSQVTDPDRRPGLGAPRPAVHRRRVFFAVVLAVLFIWAGPQIVRAQTNAGPPNTAAFNWAGFHRNDNLSGYAANSTLSPTTAATLGVRWARATYSQALDSPVVSSTHLGMLAFLGTEAGYELAFTASNGSLVWARALSGQLLSTSAVSAGALWVATSNPAALYKLDPQTGATECSVVLPRVAESSLVVATPPGGHPSVFVASLDTNGRSGPVIAIAASDCGVEWQFTDYKIATGSWAPLAYGVDRNDTPLVLVGTSDPDDTEYAINAVTGSLVWAFYAGQPGNFDIGAGATISPPGVNGSADGVAYLPTKSGTLFAIDLTTGTKLWSYVFDPPIYTSDTGTGRSTPALAGTNLVFGHVGGVVDLNAITGVLRWQYADPSGTEVLSSVAIAGKAGDNVVLAADLAGTFYALNLRNGKLLYRYQTGNYIASSPAVSDGEVLIASTDGLLYDFASGGGNDATIPSASVTSPANGATVLNPLGNEVIQGTASDPASVQAVEVAIQMGDSQGPWWNAATNAWSPGPVGNPATLTSPGVTSTAWTFALPVPSYGGNYQITVTAYSGSGQSSISRGPSQFVVEAAASGPRLQVSQFNVSPGASLVVSGQGFSPGSPITLSIQGTTIATPTATGAGAFGPFNVVIPRSTGFGESLIMAIDTSHRHSVVPIYVANTWLVPGNDPGNSGFEPNDASYANIYFLGSNSGIDPAWDYIDGSTITTSTVVANGVAYVGDASGQVLAIETANGAKLWSWQDSTGAAIDGSPTVDPVLGQVMVGTADGSIDAISSEDGQAIWSASVTGAANAPTFAGGEAYVSSSGGTVTALVESSGTVSWSTTLASPASSAVAVDRSSHVLVVGEHDGTVLALSTSSGSLAWSFNAGGAVDTTPVIYAGSVYAGSADGTLSALSETTGKLIWNYSTGAAITASPAIFQRTPPEVFVGAADGSLTGLSTVDGSVSSVNRFGGAITGVASTRGAVFITTAPGIVNAMRATGIEQAWAYNMGSPTNEPPAIVDGAAYISDASGNLVAFTPYGQAPP